MSDGPKGPIEPGPGGRLLGHERRGIIWGHHTRLRLPWRWKHRCPKQDRLAGELWPDSWLPPRPAVHTAERTLGRGEHRLPSSPKPRENWQDQRQPGAAGPPRCPLHWMAAARCGRKRKFPSTLLGSLSGPGKSTDKDRLTGAKHTDLSSVSFTRHRSFTSQWNENPTTTTKSQLNLCIFMLGLMINGQSWRNRIA